MENINSGLAMSAKGTTVLWVDLTEQGCAALQSRMTQTSCEIYRIFGTKEIDAEIRKLEPSAVCFEFDYPDRYGLAELTRIKCDHPGLPVVLITTYHSEALAVWALRARVWDYIVKPYAIDNILRALTVLSKERRRQSSTPRKIIPPVVDPANTPPFTRLTGKEKTILRAKAFIEAHLAEKFRQTAVARQCGMSLSHFSRAFRQVCGIGFSEFVLRARIEKALVLLENPGSKITSVCYEVGFSDLSYFGRAFRRYVGMTPSQYQNTRPQRASLSDLTTSDARREENIGSGLYAFDAQTNAHGAPQFSHLPDAVAAQVVQDAPPRAH
jgi:AraC-like DNA-binding protein/ActR/RegA family two-component response regulator